MSGHEADYETVLERLAAANGIAASYYDIRGNLHYTSGETRRPLLAAMGFDISSEDSTRLAVEALEREAGGPGVPDLWIGREHVAPRIPLLLDDRSAGLTWTWSFVSETGEASDGAFVPAHLERDGELWRDGIEHVRYLWTLPATPGLGYHRLSFHAQGDCAPGHELLLVISPQRCHLPDGFGDKPRAWGVSLQLYALRSVRNWGMGDFGDLGTAITTLGALGASLVGINPLHALYLREPERASPYSPSSRRFLNPLYLDVEAVADFAECGPVQRTVADPDFQARLAALRAADFVDYDGVAALKLPVLERLFAHFRDAHLANGTNRAGAFRAFAARCGEPLRLFAAHQTLLELGPAALGGQRDRFPSLSAADVPAPSLLEDIRARHLERAQLHEYLQWQSAVQLEAAAARAHASGMAIGLYRDVAVGVSPDGADASIDRTAMGRGVSIGAPPDDFSPDGQVWGLLPYDPSRLRALRFGPFLDTLRANMRCAGALRVDHILGYLRLFWVPDGERASAGAYVHYPLDELLSLLALESVRHRCVVIGEDLGTVPDELRAAIHERGILSYRVLLFERHWQGDRSFRQPQDYPEQALVTATTHDLPTLRGYARASDLAARHAVDGAPDDARCARDCDERREDVNRLCDALAQQNLANDFDLASEDPSRSGHAVLAIHRFLGRSPARIMVAQMEDVLGQVDQVNLPGTIEEYPNWRRKLPVDVGQWAGHAPLLELARALNEERPAM